MTKIKGLSNRQLELVKTIKDSREPLIQVDDSYYFKGDKLNSTTVKSLIDKNAITVFNKTSIYNKDFKLLPVQDSAYNKLAIEKEDFIVDKWNQNELNLCGIELNGKAKKLTGKYGTSKQWAQIGNANKYHNPKTDILIGKDKISVKYSNKFQICSSYKYEYICILNSLRKYLRKNTYNKGIELIDQCMMDNIHLNEPGNINDLRKKENAFVLSQVQLHNRIQNEFPSIFNNEELRLFIRECLIGECKFADSPVAIPNKMLKWCKKEDVGYVDNINDDYINKIIENMRWDFSFKTNSVKKKVGYYRAYSVLRLHAVIKD